MRSDPVALATITLGPFRNGHHDPTTVWDGHQFWRASWTPHGPGTVSIKFTSTRRDVEAYGPGGDWLGDRVGGLVGDLDEAPSVVPRHDSVERAMRSWAGMRIGRSDTPYHELLPAVLGQRVTGGEAVRQWRSLVMTLGAPAPGPRSGLMLPPDPDALAKTPYWQLHHMGIERKRADTLTRVASAAGWLIAECTDTPAERTASLTRIHGVGVWTAAVAGGAAFGDPDALQVGDFHVKNTVAWALRSRPRGTDEEMVRDLAPYEGQRHRVVRWLELDGWRAPRRGPKRRNLSVARL